MGFPHGSPLLLLLAVCVVRFYGGVGAGLWKNACFGHRY
jgi:hypothetical protein